MSEETIAEQAERLRRRLCGYVNQKRCDCKFLPPFRSDQKPNSEQTGCCELRYIIAIYEGRKW